ncbi:unnamed protein product [Arctia plantaginis]|uniref:THAP-type domain-containing protein n=1 Tax=Arctia plantaginis TaxID=874455 RepID=A0A8S0ZRV3_ARCPL|nr:unnamed protein product [Arctia plantaginis]
MSVNNYRKCAKCGKTRAEDMTVTYHRFPNPGKDNNTKAHAWAKYCWPNNDWSSRESLYSLHKTNKVLCGRHFHSSQFYDSTRKKLSKFAVPELTDLLNDETNVFNQNAAASNVAGLQKSRVPFSRIENSPVSPILVKPTNILSPLKRPTDPIQPSKSTDKEQNAPEEMLPSKSTSTKNVQSQVLPYHDESHLTKSASKKCNSILSAINVSKVSELTSREVKLYNICKKKLREIIRLRKKYKNKKIDIVKAISEDEKVQQLCDLNISNSFVVLLQSQLQNCPKKPKGRRYTLNQKIMALVIYKKSPACYRLLRRMFTLPCQSSLNKLLNRVPLKPGINRHIFTSLKKMTGNQTDEENICILSFDEISIRKHLDYDSKSDEIQGFKDHGNHGRSNEIATKALVFMLAGIRKKWKQPIAFYFSHTLTADRMTVILKEILTECINSNVNVVATVCDLSTVNLKVLKTVGVTTSEPFFLHCEKEIVAILDPPHLLKCTRNLLMKHNVECTTDVQCNDKTVKGTAKWSHIEAFHLLDKSNANFVFAPALTDHHLHPNVKQQMRVKLAAQVFSHSVTAGILAKIASSK